MPRTPLYLKLMLSYVLVVSLVVLPTFLYLHLFREREVRAQMREELRAEAQRLAAGLGSLPPEEFAAAVRLSLATSPRRLTVLDAAGVVVGDTAEAQHPGDVLAERPEIREALASAEGFGLSTRRSGALDADLLFAAARFPRIGPARGVVRLGVSTAGIEEASAGGVLVLRGALAMAGTAAVLLSLLAAFVVSRPLRRIAEGARALASGDFGPGFAVRSRDELGELSAALEELSARMRERLLSAGADRAAVRALLDDLPVGVVLYSEARALEALNGRARVLLGLSPDTEEDRAQALLALPGQAALVERALREGGVAEGPLELPWRPQARLRARWVGLPMRDGSRVPGLVLLEEPESARPLERAAAALGFAAGRLRDAARATPDSDRAAALQVAAAECEAAMPAPAAPEAAEVQAVALGGMWEAALADAAPLARLRGVSLEVQLAASAVKIVEAGGRVERALRALVSQAIERSAHGEAVAVRGEAGDTHVRISARLRAGAVDLEPIGRLVRSLGGEVGSSGAGERTESWLQVPRA